MLTSHCSYIGVYINSSSLDYVIVMCTYIPCHVMMPCITWCRCADTCITCGVGVAGRSSFKKEVVFI